MNAARLRKQLGRTKGQCTWCGSSVQKPRLNWCGDACVEAYRQAHDWSFIRSQVHDRDHGVCAICRFDSDKMLRIEQFVWQDSSWVGARDLRIWLKTIGFGETHHHDLWQADHIVPRVLGGTNALENLRTLCILCHKRVTAELAASRAIDRHDS